MSIKQTFKRAIRAKQPAEAAAISEDKQKVVIDKKSARLSSVPRTDEEIRELAYFEAELIEKQEKAIRLRRENLLASQTLVDFSSLKNLIIEHYKNSADRINEVLDMLFLKYDMPSAMQSEAWSLILRALNESLEKTVAGIDAEGKRK